MWILFLGKGEHKTLISRIFKDFHRSVIICLFRVIRVLITNAMCLSLADNFLLSASPCTKWLSGLVVLHHKRQPAVNGSCINIQLLTLIFSVKNNFTLFSVHLICYHTETCSVAPFTAE